MKKKKIWYRLEKIFDDDDDCDDFDDELEIRLTDSNKDYGDFNIGISGAKIYIEEESEYYDTILISLPEMPLLSKLRLGLFYNKD